MIYRNNIINHLYFILVLFLGCTKTPKESLKLSETSLINETSQVQAIEYYKLLSQKITDNNGTVIQVNLPKNKKILKAGIIQ